MAADAKRIAEILEVLSSFTDVPGEITRPTYAHAWREALIYLAGEMRTVGMETRVDGAGNLIGRYNPGDATSAAVGVGSHLDTVRNGGAYDGAAGIAAGLELARRMHEEDFKPARPLELIAFAEEEGGVFSKGCLGSEYITGHTPLKLLSALTDAHNVDLPRRADACDLEKRPWGADYGWGRRSYAAFFELHVEQGALLERADKSLGVVEGVVGILRKTFTFIGQSNHAGTTPMDARKDASVALAEFILCAYRYGLSMTGRLVVTNGKISIQPNQHNVVPGSASTVLEMRAPSDPVIRAGISLIEQLARRIAHKYGQTVEITGETFTPAHMFDGALRDSLRDAAPTELTMNLFSWAGHDAKLMALSTRAAMLFIPSVGGISHCPQERSDPRDIARGADLLYAAFKKEVMT